MIQRAEIKELIERLKEPRKFIHVIVGPRQVGKTTMVSQAMEQIDIPHLFFSADNIFASGEWLAEKWQSARLMVQSLGLAQLIVVHDMLCLFRRRIIVPENVRQPAGGRQRHHVSQLFATALGSQLGIRVAEIRSR